MIGLNKSSEPDTKMQETNNQVVVMGRWVTLYNEQHGPVRRSIMPRYGRSEGGDRALGILEPLLRQITGREDLKTLILLVAPTSKPNYNRKLHCFDKDTYKHLGSTCITKEELDLMERYEMLIKYEIVTTDEYLPFKSLACDTSIIAQIVQGRKKEMLSKGVNLPKPTIKSLRQPKIAVRMRALDIKRIEKKSAHETDEHRGDLMWRI